MKKMNLFMLLFLALQVTFISCDDSNEDLPAVQQNTNLTERITINVSTDILSDGFRKLGISSINVDTRNERTTYSFEAFQVFKVGSELEMFNKSIILENDMLYSELDQDFKLTLVGDEIYLKKEDFFGPVNNFMESESVTSDNVKLLFYLTEITKKDVSKISFEDFVNIESNQRAGCGFWDTYYVYSLGGNRSVSSANLPAEIESANLGSDCSPIGVPETSCLWDNTACWTTQAYCCDGYTPIGG